MAQQIFKFDRDVLDRNKVQRVEIRERGKGDWVAFIWTKNAQQAAGRGEHALEAFEKALAYLQQTFLFPVLASTESDMTPDRRPGIRRNSNNRILSSREMLVERFLAKKADMEVHLPTEDMKKVEKTTVLPVGYDDIQFGHNEVEIPEEDMRSLRNNFDNMNAKEYSGSNRYLMWLKTLATRIRELAPIDVTQGAVVATTQHDTNRFCYFRVSGINRDLVIEGTEPVIINFSRSENFQVQLFGMDPKVIFPDSIPEGSDPWTRIDL